MTTTKTTRRIRRCILPAGLWAPTSQDVIVLADSAGRPVAARGDAARVIEDLRSRGWSVTLLAGNGGRWDLEARSLVGGGL